MIFSIMGKDVKSILISVVIATTAISTWAEGFSVNAHEAASKILNMHVMKATDVAHQLVQIVCNSTLKQIMNATDVAHQFAIVCNSTQQPDKRWDLAVYVKALPQVLRNIQKVNYLAYPGFSGPNGTASKNVTSMENKFALGLNVGAGPKIHATVFFKDNQVREYPTLQINLPCVGQTCPVVFTVNPKLIGNTLKIDGSGETGNIAKIHVVWGDGYTSDSSKFPLMHKYSKSGPYTVIIAAISNRGITISQTIPAIQIGNLFLQNSIPSLSNYRYSAKANASLFVNGSSPSIEDNTPILFVVSGKLSSFNGTSVSNVPMTIHIYLVANDSVSRTYDWHTVADGTYNFRLPDLTLKDDGLYRITVRPTDQRFPALDATTVFKVNPAPNPITRDQLIAISAIAIPTAIVAITGTIKIPSFITRVKQSNNFRIYQLYLNFEYNRYKNTKNRSEIDKDRYVNTLEASRNSIMDLVGTGKITDSQYIMLDNLISRYINKIDNINPK
jgi:hypothetical protein